jgi:predicted nucleotidyltransferase
MNKQLHMLSTTFEQLTCPIPAIAVLVGSRALGTNSETSDWDIAIWWLDDNDPWQQLGNTETLRRALASALKTSEDKIDLIDFNRAGLAMREKIANEGQLIYTKKPLTWMHFLTRTWWEIEQFYWDKKHVNLT